jgi:hypothetical protein
MPGKMTKSILRPPFRPPRYRKPSAARVYLAGRSEKRKYSPQLGSHLGNPGLLRLVTVHPKRMLHRRPRWQLSGR